MTDEKSKYFSSVRRLAEVKAYLKKRMPEIQDEALKLKSFPTSSRYSM